MISVARPSSSMSPSSCWSQASSTTPWRAWPMDRRPPAPRRRGGRPGTWGAGMIAGGVMVGPIAIVGVLGQIVGGILGRVKSSISGSRDDRRDVMELGGRGGDRGPASESVACSHSSSCSLLDARVGRTDCRGERRTWTKVLGPVASSVVYSSRLGLEGCLGVRSPVSSAPDPTPTSSDQADGDDHHRLHPTGY